MRGATTVNGASLTIAYDEALDTGSVPAATAYAPLVGGSPRGVSNVSVAGSNVTLTLASPVVAGDPVTLSYAAPATNPVQDVAGNDAASFSGAAVTNQTPPGGGSTLTFAPTDDAQVRSSTTTTNFGAMTTIRVGGEGTTTTYRTYLKFDVSGLTGPVTSVKLRLFATDASPNIVHVLPVADTIWTESVITWANKPATGTPDAGAARRADPQRLQRDHAQPDVGERQRAGQFRADHRGLQQRDLQQLGGRQRPPAGRHARLTKTRPAVARIVPCRASS